MIYVYILMYIYKHIYYIYSVICTWKLFHQKKSTQPAPQEAASQQMQGPSLGAPSSFRGVGRIGASEGQGGQGFEGWVGTGYDRLLTAAWFQLHSLWHL